MRFTRSTECMGSGIIKPTSPALLGINFPHSLAALGQHWDPNAVCGVTLGAARTSLSTAPASASTQPLLSLLLCLAHCLAAGSVVSRSSEEQGRHLKTPSIFDFSTGFLLLTDFFSVREHSTNPEY